VHGTIASDIASLYKWLILIEIGMKWSAKRKVEKKLAFDLVL